MTDQRPDATSSETSKICGICHRDCSTVPRIIDKKRKVYYCRACAVEAVQRRKQLMEETAVGEDALDDSYASAPSQPSAASALGRSGDIESLGDSSIIDEILNAPELPSYGEIEREEMLAASSSSAGPTGKVTDRRNAGKVDRFLYEQGLDNNALNQTWPMFVGATTIAFGLIGLFVYTTNLVQAILAGFENSDTMESSLWIGSALLLPALSVWMLVAGKGIWNRTPSAVLLIQRWAWTKVGLSIAYLTTILCLTVYDEAPHGAFSFGIDVSHLSGASYTTTNVAIFAALIFWPTFLIVWFSRNMTKVSVKGWARSN